MTLTDYRGNPVAPRIWLDGYLAVHPVQKEPAPTMGFKLTPHQYIGPKQAWRLLAELDRRDEDGNMVRDDELTYCSLLNCAGHPPELTYCVSVRCPYE